MEFKRAPMCNQRNDACKHLSLELFSKQSTFEHIALLCLVARRWSRNRNEQVDLTNITSTDCEKKTFIFMSLLLLESVQHKTEPLSI